VLKRLGGRPLFLFLLSFVAPVENPRSREV